MDRNKIIPPKRNGWSEEDRIAVAALLIKAGFAVKIIKGKNGNSTDYGIEFWKE